MEAKMEPQGTQNQKKTKKGHSKKQQRTTLPKVGYWLHFGLKMGIYFRTGSAPKITKIKQILKMGPRASKMSPRASQMTTNDESDLPKSKKSRCKTPQKLHCLCLFESE